MTLIVACPNCQTRYNLPDKFQGKKVKCKSCGKPFSATVGASRATAGRVNQETQRAPQVDTKALANMGISELRSQPDPFAAPAHKGPDPLRNHVVQDPGFGAPVIPGTAPAIPGHAADEDDDPNAEFQSVVSNPYITPAKPKRDSGGRPAGEQKRKKQQPVVWYKQPWFLLLVVFIPMFLLSIVLSATGIVGEGVGGTIAMIAFGIFSIANAVIGFWGLFLVNRIGGTLQVVLCWLVPFYILVFIGMNWGEMKNYAYAIISGFLLLPLGVVMLILAGSGLSPDM